MKRAFLLLAATLITLTLNGCLGGAFNLGSSAPPPPDVRVIAADSSVTITWTASPNVEYWVFAAPGNSVTPDNWNSIGGFAFPKATSPLVIHNLTNGKTYSFTLNARIDGGPGGPGSPSISATPRLAGASWATASSPGNLNLNGVTAQDDASGKTRFVAVGDAGTLAVSNYFNANTAVTWTQPALTLNTPKPNFYTAVYGGVFLAAGSGGAILRSTDATTWTAQTSGTTSDIYAIATNGAGGYVAVGQGGLIMTSLDGITWTTQNSGTNRNLYAATYGDGAWIAVGQGGILLTSANAINWATVSSNTARDLTGVSYGITIDPATSTSVGAFIAVGASGTQLTSTDHGATWRASLINNGINDLKAIIYGRQFVAVGNGGSIYTSTDGASWTLQTSGTTSNLNAIGHGTAGLLTAGNSGVSLSAF